MRSFSRKFAFYFGIFIFLHIIYECFIINNHSFSGLSITLFTSFITSLTCAVCGIFCSFYYADNKTTRPIIYFIYSYSLTLFNFYSPNMNYLENYTLSPVFCDALNAVTIAFMFHFIYQSYSPTRVKKVPKDIFCFAPILVCAIKYFLFLFNPDWTLRDNPLSNMTLVILLLTVIIILAFFLYVVIVYSQTQTMLFKYLVFGVIYSSIGPVLILIKSLVIHQDLIEISDMISIFVSLTYVPIIISLSVYQYRSEKVNNFIRKLITFLGFWTLYILILDTLFDTLSMRGAKTGSAICVVLSPFVFKAFNFLVNRSLSIENGNTNKILDKYKNDLNQTTTTNDVISLSAATITKLFNPKYMFFYMKQDKDWNVAYSNAPEDYVQVKIQQINQLKYSKHIHIFEDGTTLVTYFQNNEPTMKIYLSRKINNDQYLPSELSLLQKYTDTMMNQLLIQSAKKTQTELKTVSHHAMLMDKEIQLAAFVQKSFYPQNINAINGWDFAYYCRPMAGVSGDLYDFYMREDELDGVGIFDVSGHGISSGLVTMLIRNIIRHEFYKNKDKPLDEVMNIIDTRFRKEKNDIENFLTGILMRIDGNKIELVNAAHPYPIIYRKSENDVYFLNKVSTERSTIIGFNDMEPHFVNTELTLESGDEIILYTDGINESIDSNRKQYGLSRLLGIATKNINLPVEEQSKAIIDDIKLFVGEKASPTDDMTMIILKKK